MTPPAATESGGREPVRDDTEPHLRRTPQEQRIGCREGAEHADAAGHVNGVALLRTSI
jgi:hypothetical protein